MSKRFRERGSGGAAFCRKSLKIQVAVVEQEEEDDEQQSLLGRVPVRLPMATQLGSERKVN